MVKHTVSDHTPLQLRFQCKVERRVNKGPPPFKFNTSFLKDELFCKRMRAVWEKAKSGINHPVERWQAGMDAVINLAKAKGKGLAKFKRSVQSGLENALQCSRAAAIQNPNDQILLHLLQVLEGAAKKIETDRAEAARVQSNLYWLRVGDAPNKTFFKALRAKKDCELITALRRSDASITEDEAEIKVMLKESLSDIVGKPDTWNDQTKLKLNRFLEPLDDKISEEKKLLLGRPFSVYEVETVVKGMKKEKTPGPDGIQAEVLQEMIEYAGQDLCDLLNHWRKEGSIQPNFNQGLIKVIPKGQDRLEIRNYRPLTMLNSVYKVMAKALALRIKYVVNQVVHPKQFGFVQGRSIHEAILNVITTIDWAAEQDQDYVMINMDLEKAYDRVSWDFILAVVDRLGFGNNFLGMVKTLFQNANASIQINGYISDNFQLARSIRQGCPLAPLLFAITTDPLLRNLDLQMQRQAIRDLPLPQGQSFLTQLFADDNCNIVRCEQGSITALMQVYEDFCEVSGSKIAPHKTECLRLTYKEDTGVLDKCGLTDAGVGTIIRYLGCPIGLGLTQSQCSSWIKQRIEAKVYSRNHLRLSLAGRLIVLKHVLMALPVYLATIVSFSGSHWKCMDKIFRDYLWRFADKDSWHCISWNHVCSSTDKGGWGIPNIVEKAQSLLFKWVNKLECEEPWACIVRERIKNAKLLGYSWPSTHWGDKLLYPVPVRIKNAPALQNIVKGWKVRLGKVKWRTNQRFDSSLNQSIWLCKDAMENDQPSVLLNPQLAIAMEKKGFAVFKDIWDSKSQQWGVDQRRWRTLKPREKVFITQVIQGIKEGWPTNPLVATQPKISNWDLKGYRPHDPPQPWIRKMATDWAKDRCFVTEDSLRKKVKQTWKATISRRYNLLLWRIITRKVPVNVVCSKWGAVSPYCPRCHTCKETVKHAFWDCKCISPIWRSCSGILENFGFSERITWKQALLGFKGRMNPAIMDIWQYIRSAILSKIWQDRNLIAHRKPALCFDSTKMRLAMVEGCLLAKEVPRTRAQASTILKKMKQIM
ncbi:hypothetical protein L7F22_010905 [Adiantum nelumboides]|nr:hypothetical protein [Adiantum nelumboides]